MARLYKKTEDAKNWYVDIRHDEYGEKIRRRLSTGQSNKANAKKWAEAKEKQLIQELWNKAHGINTFDIKVHELLQTYYKDYSLADGNLKDTTQHRVPLQRLTGVMPKKRGGNIFYDPIPNVYCSAISGRDFQSLINKRKKDGLADSNILKELVFVQGAFKQFKAWHKGFPIPDIDWKSFRKQLRPFENLRVATEEELEKIKEQIKVIGGEYTQFHIDMFETLRYTCARVGEIINLQWNQIDLDYENIEGQKVGGMLIIRPKTNNRNWMAFNPDTPMRDIMARRKRFNESFASRPSPYVFQSPRKKEPAPLNTSRNSVIRRAIDLAGLNDNKELVERDGPFTIHSIRRTSLTELHRKGVNDFVLQQIAGHSSPTTTKRYINTAQNSLDFMGILAKNTSEKVKAL